MTNRVYALIGAIVFLCLPLFGQTPAGYINLSQVRLTDSNGNPASNISVCAQAVNEGKPLSVRVGGGGVTLTRPVCTTVTWGSWSMSLPDGALSSPQYATYSLSAIDNLTGENLLAGYSHVQPSSVAPSETSGWWCSETVCELDNLDPNAPAQSLIVAGPAGPKGDSGTNGCVVGSGVCATVVQTNPSADQVVAQPTGTTLKTTINGTVPASDGGIDAAIASAGVSQSVIIPKSVTTPESYRFNNSNNAAIQDQRPNKQSTSLLQVLSMMPLLYGGTHGDLSQLVNCVEAKHCIIVGNGDSTMEARTIAPEDGYFAEIVNILKAHYPDVTFDAYNLAVGGTTLSSTMSHVCGTDFNRHGNNWPMPDYFPNSSTPEGDGDYSWPAGCINGDTVLQNTQAYAPDLVIMGNAVNENGSSTGAYAVTLQSYVNAVKAFPKTPTLVLVATVPPEVYQTWNRSNDSNTPLYQGLANVTRGIAEQNNLPIIDGDRLLRVYRDGSDVLYNPKQFMGCTKISGTPHCGFVDFPAQWTTVGSSWGLSVGGGSPTVTNADVMTLPAGGAVAVNHYASQDTRIDAVFSGTGSIGTIIWRATGYTTAATPRYQLNVAIGSNTTNNGGVYYYADGHTPTQISNISCDTTVLAYIGVVVKGPKVTIYCNAVKNYEFYDYNLLAAGYSGVGVQVGAGTVQNFYLWHGNPPSDAVPFIQDEAFNGVNGVQNTDGQSGTYFYSPPSIGAPSIGGDWAVHLTPLGYHSIYTVAAMPLLQLLDTRISDYKSAIRTTGALSGFVANSNAMDYGNGYARQIATGPNTATKGKFERLCSNSDGSAQNTCELVNETGVTSASFNPSEGMSSDSGGLKHKVVALTATSAGAGNASATTLTWTTPFADANYTLSCTLDSTGSTGTAILSVYNKTAAGAMLDLYNVSSNPNGGSADCVGIHAH